MNQTADNMMVKPHVAITGQATIATLAMALDRCGFEPPTAGMIASDLGPTASKPGVFLRHASHSVGHSGVVEHLCDVRKDARPWIEPTVDGEALTEISGPSPFGVDSFALPDIILELGEQAGVRAEGERITLRMTAAEHDEFDVPRQFSIAQRGKELEFRAIGS